MKIIIGILLVSLASICMAADYQAEVVSPRHVVGIGREPVVWKQYSAACGENWHGEDVTGQRFLTEPNLMVTQIVCDNATIDKMATDGYKVLWSKKVPVSVEPGTSVEPVEPFPKETKAALDTLKTDLKALGITDAHLSATALADTSKADVTGAGYSTQLKDVMQKFPKATATVEEPKVPK